MRRTLLAAVAAAPLFAVLAGAAEAQTVISDQRTTPVNTSTANNGAANDVRIASTGAVRPTSGAAVTLDSDDDVTNEGTIEIKNSDGAVGILVQGGRTGAVINRNAISIVEDYTPTDTDSDGDVDGAFAQGRDRYGIRLTGAGAFVGSITTETASRISVEGNDSFGVSVESALNGNLTVRGQTIVLGDRARGLSVTGPVSGNILVDGVTALGLGAVGTDLAGAVGGRFTVGGTVASTGYRSTTRPTDASKLDADDLLQGGPAVRISANVAGGVLVDAPPQNLDANDPDEDKDGVPDAQQTAGKVQTFGSAPALLVAAAGRDITLGAVTGGTAGLVVRGQVSAAGVYDERSATAIQIGDTGAGLVNLSGGLRVSGGVDAGATKADATGIRLAGGARAPLMEVSGAVSAVTAGGAGNARALLIEAGASAPTLRNSRSLTAAVAGGAPDVWAVEDRSGTLTLVENSGAIAANRVVAATDTVTGRRIALDLAANTSGVTVRQFGVTDGDDGGDQVADPDADGDGVDNGDEPLISGDVRFGSGADVFEVLNGAVNGAVSFGAGADRLLIDGTGLVSGVITDTDGRLALDVRKGVLDFTTAQTLQASSLNVAADGAVYVTIDGVAGTATRLNITGAANFATGSGVGVRLSSLITGPQRHTVIQAASLESTGLKSETAGATPYLFVTSVGSDEAAGTVFVDVRRRTAEEAGLTPAQAGAFDAIYGALGQDTGVRDVFLAQTTREGFSGLYEQLLPEHSGGAAYALATGSAALGRTVRERVRQGRGGRAGGWLQEVGYTIRRDAGADAGFEADGFGLMGGVETPGFGGAVGVSAAWLTGNLDEPSSAFEESTNLNMFEGGVYWRGEFGGLITSARAGVGWTGFESDRRFSATGLSRQAAAEWNGLSATGHLGAAYEAAAGRFYARPELSLDSLYLKEGDHEETGGGAGFDLRVDERTSTLFTGSAMAHFGARFGRDSWVAPEVSVGWRQFLGGSIGDTTARFRAGGTPFTISAADVPQGAAVVGVGVTGGSEWAFVALQARGEIGDDYEAADLRLNVKFKF